MLGITWYQLGFFEYMIGTGYEIKRYRFCTLIRKRE